MKKKKKSVLLLSLRIPLHMFGSCMDNTLFLSSHGQYILLKKFLKCASLLARSCFFFFFFLFPLGVCGWAFRKLWSRLGSWQLRAHLKELYHVMGLESHKVVTDKYFPGSHFEKRRSYPHTHTHYNVTNGK